VPTPTDTREPAPSATSIVAPEPSETKEPEPTKTPDPCKTPYPWEDLMADGQGGGEATQEAEEPPGEERTPEDEGGVQDGQSEEDDPCPSPTPYKTPYNVLPTLPPLPR
jgi:hypothetical protein